MINPIDSTTESGAGRQSSKTAGASSGTSFAAIHKAAVTGNDAVTSAAKKKDASVPASELKPPKGETWEPVAGRSDYADIVSGPRNGYYVNLKPGPRQGEAFHLVKRDGRTFHIYGEGKNREVIEVKDRVDPGMLKPRADEAWNKVKGHRDFKEIDGGERDGLHVNTSGNERTGKTFRLVNRDDRILHIYGEGKNRQVIEVGSRNRETEKPEDTGKSEKTGSPDPAKGE